ncbi:unnamed protein product [Penicillium bialowiezense]
MSHGGLTRRACRRTDDFKPDALRLKFVEEALPPLAPTDVLISVHAVAISFQDAEVAKGYGPRPAPPNGMVSGEAAGEVIAVGDKVKTLVVGRKVAPIANTANISGREVHQSWLAANEDGVMADYLVFDESVICVLPDYLDWAEASLVPVVGLTAWSALKGMSMGQTVLIQGIEVVSIFALKLAIAAGLRVFFICDDYDVFQQMKVKYPSILTMEYPAPKWDREIMRLTGGVGVDLVVQTGGTESLIKSLRCTKRGGIVSQVGGSLDQNKNDLWEIVPTIMDRRINLRGINSGSRHDMEDLCAALSATQLPLGDLIECTFAFDEAEEAVEYVWERQLMGTFGKIVLLL